MFRPITANWQDRVKAELVALGWTQDEFSKRLKCSPGAVTGLLKPGARTSRLVDRASKLLQIAPPEFADDIEEQHFADLRRLRAVKRAAYDDIMQRVARELRRGQGDDEP